MAIPRNLIKIRITLNDEMLGMAPSSKEIYREFIASRAPEGVDREEEIATIGVDAAVEKGTTIFPRNAKGEPIVFDYQIKGFMKDACGFLRRVPGTESSKCKAYKKIIDGNFFVYPKQIAIRWTNGEMGTCQRPLRASTPQGERNALACSETVPAEAVMEF